MHNRRANDIRQVKSSSIGKLKRSTGKGWNYFLGWLKSGTWHSEKAFGVYGLLIAALGLFYAATQTRTMIRQMRAEQRPWVKVHSPECKAAKSGEDIYCTFPIVNSGPTPAILTSVSFDGIFSPDKALPPEALRVFLDHLPDKEQTDHVPPDMTIYWPVVAVPKVNVTPESLAAIEQNKQFFYVAGRIKYLDINGEPHVTEFCFSSTGNGPVEGRELNLVPGFSRME